ncbi:STM3941 family protein [Streptomyces sp. NPDC001795]|uniref:STM3941 family protein n=1 Tax=unclassified Streptomyces TaxID=2593676 RepID=UPI00332AF457
MSSAPDDPSATVYQSSGRTTWLVAFGSVALVVGGVWMLIAHDSFIGILIGAFAVLFSGLCACVAIGRVLRPRPELVLTREGLTHARLGSISWSEIAEVRVREIETSYTSQMVIELVLHDQSAYLARAPRLTRIFGWVNLLFGYSPTTISATTLPVDLDEVVRAMRHHHPKLKIRS